MKNLINIALSNKPRLIVLIVLVILCVAALTHGLLYPSPYMN